jgi:drug/metabolite transporter (DMT)-like permease
VNLRKYLVLLAVMCVGSIGDALLSRGMKQLGPINLHHWQEILRPMGNPWILLGILCLTVFFASYLTALSFADLSYVLPATALGYVLVTLIARFAFHENVSVWRWLGVLLISCGVGWVTQGPELTERPRETSAAMQKEQHEVA